MAKSHFLRPIFSPPIFQRREIFADGEYISEQGSHMTKHPSKFQVGFQELFEINTTLVYKFHLGMLVMRQSITCAQV
jgi:hypothetical protein